MRNYLIATIILFIITISLVGLLAAFLLSYGPGGQTNIIAFNESSTLNSCVNGTITVYLWNEGLKIINTSQILLSGVTQANVNLGTADGSGLCDPIAKSFLLNPQNSTVCSNKLIGAASGQNNYLYVRLLSGNTAGPLAVFCS